MENKQNLRLMVRTNKLLNLIVAIETDKTVRELAHRILNCYIELVMEHANGATIPKKRDLEVSSIKFQDYYISKQEIVGSILRDNDQIQCILVKAKPKYPKQSRSYVHTLKQMNELNTLKPLKNANEAVINQIIEPVVSPFVAMEKPRNPNNTVQDSLKKKNKKNKKQRKKKKMIEKQKMRQQERLQAINAHKSHQQKQNIEKRPQIQQISYEAKGSQDYEKNKKCEQYHHQEGDLSKNFITGMQLEAQERNQANEYERLEEEMNIISRSGRSWQEEAYDQLEGPKSPSFNFVVGSDMETNKKVMEREKREENPQESMDEEVIKEEFLPSQMFPNASRQNNENQSVVKELDEEVQLEQKQKDKNINEKFAGTEQDKEKQKQKGKEKQKQKQKQKQKSKEKEKTRNKPKPEKVERIHSIMSMLFETVQNKKKRNKKDPKQKEISNKQKQKQKEKQKQNVRTGNKEEMQKMLTSQTKINSQQNPPSNRVASPKVTFHSSPAFAPQDFKIASPQMKLNNPLIQMQKLELQQNIALNCNNIKVTEPEQKQAMRIVSKNEQKVSKKVDTKNTTTGGPKIIIQEQSEAQSQGQAGTKQSKTSSIERRDNKLAEIDEKINKYGLHLLDLSQDDEQE